MKRLELNAMDSSDLVMLFARIAVAQDEADLGGQMARYKRLFAEMMDVCNELKSRAGDQRRKLTELFTHPNMHVRLQAANLTLAVAPVEAREQLEAIVSANWFPQSGDAGMTIRGLEDGTFKPE